MNFTLPPQAGPIGLDLYSSDSLAFWLDTACMFRNGLAIVALSGIRHTWPNARRFLDLGHSGRSAKPFFVGRGSQFFPRLVRAARRSGHSGFQSAGRHGGSLQRAAAPRGTKGHLYD
jgi:hypothetical protein